MNHFYHQIPGWFSFRGLYEQAVREAPDPARFVEVGCWKGRSTAFMAVEIFNSKKDITFFFVDTWLGSQEPKHLADKNVKNGTLFDEFSRNIGPVKHRLQICRAPSDQAAAIFEDLSLDFVMIDAAHDFQNVMADINAWWPKIRPGGTMAGDDYYFKGVRQAVNESFFNKVEEIKGSGNGIQWRVRKDCSNVQAFKGSTSE